MARPQKFKPDELIEAADRCFGIILLMAQDLKCSFSTVENYVKRYPSVEAALRRGRRKLRGFGESKLLDNLRKGQEKSIFFVLRYMNEDGTYTEKQERKTDNTHHHDGSLNVKFQDIPEDTFARLLQLIDRARGEKERGEETSDAPETQNEA